STDDKISDVVEGSASYLSATDLRFLVNNRQVSFELDVSNKHPKKIWMLVDLDRGDLLTETAKYNPGVKLSYRESSDKLYVLERTGKWGKLLDHVIGIMVEYEKDPTSSK